MAPSWKNLFPGAVSMSEYIPPYSYSTRYLHRSALPAPLTTHSWKKCRLGNSGKSFPSSRSTAASSWNAKEWPSRCHLCMILSNAGVMHGNFAVMWTILGILRGGSVALSVPVAEVGSMKVLLMKVVPFGHISGLKLLVITNSWRGMCRVSRLRWSRSCLGMDVAIPCGDGGGVSPPPPATASTGSSVDELEPVSLTDLSSDSPIRESIIVGRTSSKSERMARSASLTSRMKRMHRSRMMTMFFPARNDDDDDDSGVDGDRDDDRAILPFFDVLEIQ
mmetsp:Transcript_14412/g.39699  ORF Transcript_14412/g.39699 Transcript_14412/m.39699 type:complete len:277 (+) Transcript_14412:590-1420(+)